MEKEKPKCPLCGSTKIALTHITKRNEGSTLVSTRIYCSDCKKAMTITGRLVWTVEEVKG